MILRKKELGYQQSKYLTEKHILRPAATAINNGANYDRYFVDNPENRYIWSENSVRSILRSPTYAGHLTAYKRPAMSMKSKKRPSRLPEDWEIIKNTHEAIVSEDDFYLVQKLITGRRDKANKSGYENVFAGIIKCADCGYAIRTMVAHRPKRPEIIDRIVYCCANYARYGKDVCTAHTIEARILYETVLDDINRFAEMAQNDETMIKILQNKLKDVSDNEEKVKEREYKRLKKRLSELDTLFISLYEDKVLQKITERNFAILGKKYEAEQIELQQRLIEMESELNNHQENRKNILDFVQNIKRFSGIKKLTASIVNSIIERITISESHNESGEFNQIIKIYYRFIGKIN